MNYAILRVQKLKSGASVRRSMQHAFREQTTPNAVDDLTPENTQIGANSTAEGLAAFNAALPDKVRKNAVLAVEYLMTASPEAMAGMSREAQDAYFSDCLDWLKDKHGAENVVMSGVHRDETTPHMYAYVVPIDQDTGRLNCRKFLGGSKALSDMQTHFAAQVGQKHGLDRGVKRSKAKHQDIKTYYSLVSQAVHNRRGVVRELRINASDLAPRDMPHDGSMMAKLHKALGGKTIESEEGIAHRLTEEMNRAIANTLAEAAVSVERKKKLQAKREEVESYKRSLAPLQEALAPLHYKNRHAAVKAMTEFARKQVIEQKREQERQKDARLSRDRGFSR